MNRRTCLCCIGTGLSTFVLGTAARGADTEKPDLEETLRFGLRCRKPEEVAFVEMVVQKVDQKELPLDMVLSMFKWSRERRPNIPFYYFQAGLRKRAAEIGVEL